MLASALSRRPALLARPGLRDWIYAPAAAVLAPATVPRWTHGIYEVAPFV